MALSPLPLESDVQIVVDWLEFKILCSEYGIASISDLQRTFDIRRNTEDRDFEDGDSDENDFLTLLGQEISHRIECLGDCYPFVLSESGESLSITTEMTDGAFIYLFCLFLSHHKQGEIFDGSYLPEITNEVRDLFQACSTIAAAAVVGGHAYSFGFPRPDNTNFLTKLRLIYTKFGESAVVDRYPRGSARSTKDDQIDVIAWKERNDAAAGKVYLLGQVASGNNWPNKSIKGGPIDKFHGTWFIAPHIASQPMAALFIPFCILPEEGDTKNERIHVLGLEFGNVYYRHVLPSLAQDGINLATRDKALVVERLSDVPHVIKWVTDQVNSVRKVALQ